MDNIGERTRKLRELNKISLEEMSQRTGLSSEQISKIESNSFVPSLGALIKISRALGMRLGTLLDDQDNTGPVINKKESYKEAASFSNSDDALREHMKFFSLAHHKSGRHMEPFIIEILPGEEAQNKLSSHEGEEFIYVLEGRIEIQYGKESYTLEAGESIYYDSVLDHCIRSKGNHNARILAVIYVPV